MNRFSSESRITEEKFDGDPLIPEPVDQSGLECVLIAISYAGQMDMRRVSFGRGLKCDIVFDAKYFKYIYERETRVSLMYDRTPRIRGGLTIFRDFVVQIKSPTLKFKEGHVAHLIDFRSYPPWVHPITGKLMEGLSHSQVMQIIRDKRPVLGSFPVDELFSELGPNDIYDYKPTDASQCATHCVMFMDGGTDEEGRDYLKFLNSHGPGFGDNGFGRIYFDCIYQANSEYCFHTLSFEYSPTSPQHAPPRRVSDSSTADPVPETYDNQEQLGVTPAGLMDPLTQADHKRTDELHQFLASSHLSENLEDSDMRKGTLVKLDGIVKRCVKHITEKGHLTDMPKILVLPSGSYSLRVHIPSAALEVLCVGPVEVNREEFFETLHEVVRNMKEVADLEPVQKVETIDEQHSSSQEAVDMQRSASRVLKFKLYEKAIILLYVVLSEVPAERSTIFQDKVLSHIDEANLACLDRCRATNMILELVPNIENFRTALRYVNFWARRRGVYSDMTGFLGDIHWAIMVARVCQIYPRAPASVLVMKFFQEYSRWFWPNPVMLCLIDQKDPFAAWNGPGNKADESHVMPIITPAYPCRNSSSYVSAFTLVKLKEEFTLGFDICEKIKKGEARWSDLCESLDFFKLYKRYLLLSITVKDAGDLWIWKQKVEPLWRQLPLKIEAHGDKTMRAHLHP